MQKFSMPVIFRKSILYDFSSASLFVNFFGDYFAYKMSQTKIPNVRAEKQKIEMKKKRLQQ